MRPSKLTVQAHAHSKGAHVFLRSRHLQVRPISDRVGQGPDNGTRKLYEQFIGNFPPLKSSRASKNWQEGRKYTLSEKENRRFILILSSRTFDGAISMRGSRAKAPLQRHGDVEPARHRSWACSSPPARRLSRLAKNLVRWRPRPTMFQLKAASSSRRLPADGGVWCRIPCADEDRDHDRVDSP